MDALSYGNCDISDWEGSWNTNNSNRALTGFWIESSLLVSPKEQVAVMERIFGEGSDYTEEAQNALKQVMLVPETGGTGVSIYGKTGMGKANGVVVDAWFTGFAESAAGKIYFLRAPWPFGRHGGIQRVGKGNRHADRVECLRSLILNPCHRDRKDNRRPGNHGFPGRRFLLLI